MDVLEIVNTASKSSDRWLFIAILLLFFSFGWLCVKWLIKQIELQRIAYHLLLTKSLEENKELSVQLMEIIEKNTTAVQVFTSHLQQLIKNS